MKKKLLPINKSITSIVKNFLLVALCFTTLSSFAQNFSLPLTTGYPIEISYLNGNTICAPTSATVSSSPEYYYVGAEYPPITRDMISSNEGTHHLAVAREDNVIVVEVINAGLILSNNNFGLYYTYGAADGTSSSPSLSTSPVISPTNPDNLRWELPFRFENPTQLGYLSFMVIDGDIDNGTQTGNMVVIPFTVIVSATKNSEAPILDTSTVFQKIVIER